MKKKLICILICVLLVMGAVCTLAACTNKNDEHVLNIVLLNKGYGKEWIEPIIQKFKDENPGYDVKLEASSSAANLIKNKINSRRNTDDLYISVGADWLTYAAKGQLAELDDIMEDEVDGIKLKDKVATEYQSSVLYPNMKNGKLHTYRLPWVSATGGIFYNKKMFQENGWEVPTTFQELLDLCDEIVAAELPDKMDRVNQGNVKPFVYTGQNPDYFDYAVYTWWGQLAGESKIREFTKYSNKNIFDASVNNSTYSYLKEAVGLWNQLIGANVNKDGKVEGKYVNRSICASAANDTAQMYFAQGRAAMMFNGDWIYTEMTKLMEANPDFELGFMPLPTAPNAVDTEMLYTVGEDQWIGVPESSIKKDLAKKFIKIIVSDFGCKSFLQNANGLLAYKCNYEESDYQGKEFLKDLVNVRNACNKPFTDYPKDMTGNLLKDNRLLYLTHKIHNFWGTSSLRPYDSILHGNSVETAFSEIVSGINREWDTWRKNTGLA